MFFNSIILKIFIFICFCSSFVFGSPVSEVKKTIEDYCKLELSGAILSNDYSKFKEILIAPYKQLEFLGDGFDIIAEYKIERIEVDMNLAKATVKYLIVGQLDGPYRLSNHDKSRNYRVTYTLKKNKNWKIKSSIYPRVSIDGTIKHLNKLIKNTSDEEKKSKIKKIIDTLMKRKEKGTFLNNVRGREGKGDIL